MSDKEAVEAWADIDTDGNVPKHGGQYLIFDADMKRDHDKPVVITTKADFDAMKRDAEIGRRQRERYTIDDGGPK